VKVLLKFDGVVEELQTFKSERKIKGRNRCHAPGSPNCHLELVKETSLLELLHMASFLS
jgi:hypothetical protein